MYFIIIIDNNLLQLIIFNHVCISCCYYFCVLKEIPLTLFFHFVCLSIIFSFSADWSYLLSRPLLQPPVPSVNH